MYTRSYHGGSSIRLQYYSAHCCIIQSRTTNQSEWCSMFQHELTAQITHNYTYSVVTDPLKWSTHKIIFIDSRLFPPCLWCISCRKERREKLCVCEGKERKSCNYIPVFPLGLNSNRVVQVLTLLSLHIIINEGMICFAGLLLRIAMCNVYM